MTKKKKPEDKKKVGRHCKIDENMVKKLRVAFLSDCTDLEACLEAGISKQTLYTYQAQNPEFLDQKELWKNNLKLKARYNIAKAIEEGDEKLSIWYLERKCSDEFSTSQKTENVNLNTEIKAVDRKTISEAIKKIKELQE